MKISIMKSQVAPIFMLALMLMHAAQAAKNKEISRGPKKKLGHGFLQNYVKFNEEGVPVEVGVELDEILMDLETLPQRESDGKYDIIDPTDGSVGWYCCGHEVELKSFDGGRFIDVPFSHFVANYNPKGHMPIGIYKDIPHFDFHFEIVSKKDRISIQAPNTLDDTCQEIPGFIIPVTCEDLDILTAEVPLDQVPPVNCCPFAGATVEPAMGNHLIDVTSAEFNGGDFTHTWIYGTQAGEVSFWEPMITVEYFLQLKAATGPFDDANGGVVTHDGTIAKMTKEINAIPLKAPVAGYYPTEYTVEYDSSTATFRAALTDLTLLEVSDGENLTQLCEQPYACGSS
eukprot:scaffold79794_cov66-Attheya_sp.AAC.1